MPERADAKLGSLLVGGAVGYVVGKSGDGGGECAASSTIGGMRRRSSTSHQIVCESIHGLKCMSIEVHRYKDNITPAAWAKLAGYSKMYQRKVVRGTHKFFIYMEVGN